MNSGSTSTHNNQNDNIIIFGIADDRYALQWRSKVDDVLLYVADRAVYTVDTYQLGQYNSGKTRPVLVKLRTVWDKHIILSISSKLKNYATRGIYVAPDEPLETSSTDTQKIKISC